MQQVTIELIFNKDNVFKTPRLDIHFTVEHWGKLQWLDVWLDIGVDFYEFADSGTWCGGVHSRQAWNEEKQPFDRRIQFPNKKCGSESRRLGRENTQRASLGRFFRRGDILRQNRKWTDRSHSLTQQINHSLFLRSSEGETGGVLWTMSHFHFADEGMALLSWGPLSL